MRGVLVIALVWVAGCAAVKTTARYFDKCPDPTELTQDAIARSTKACRPADRFLVPSATFGTLRAGGSRWRVAGGQAALVSWRHPAPFAGPSHGELTLGAAYAWDHRDEGRRMVLLEGTARLTPERSAGRSWLIPYLGTAGGKNLSSDLPQSFYLAPLAGLHLFWWAGARGHAALSFEAQYHLPFEAFDELRGARFTVQLAASRW